MNLARLLFIERGGNLKGSVLFDKKEKITGILKISKVKCMAKN
jgi:hypothetical protein